MTLATIIKEKTKLETTHIAGMFTIQANEAFLNGATGSGGSEDKNVSTVKQYWKKSPVPYVSSQAWRRWLRNTLCEETGWQPSTIEAIEWNANDNTSQVAGQLNPVDFYEDDLFGYMLAKAKDNEKLHENLARDRLPEVKLIRTSPFKSSILSGIQGLVKINEDEGFVHLKNEQPLPYKTQFYSGELSALFGLELYRLGVFENPAGKETTDSKIKKADFELDPFVIKNNESVLEKIDHPIYDKGEIVLLRNLKDHQVKLTSELLRALVRMRGGSKLTQFGTDVSPKFIIICGLKTGNILFDNIIVPQEGEPAVHIAALHEIIGDYKDKMTTPVFIGVRTGYLTNEDELRDFVKSETNVNIGTPIEAIDQFLESIN